MSAFWISLLLSLCLLAESDSVVLKRVQPNLFMCGPNAIYLLLKLKGHDVPYSEVMKGVAVNETGVSLTDMRNDLHRLGLPCEIIRCRPQQLVTLLAPYIMYTHTPPLAEEIGHFVVVVNVDRDYLYVLDGTTGKQKRYKVDKITNIWDGIVIVPQAPQWPRRTLLSFVALVSLCVAARFRQKLLTSLRSCISRPSMQRSLGAFVALCATTGAMACAGELPTDPWRYPGNDAVNTLYLYLRANGYQGDYREFQAQAQLIRDKPTMASLCRMARQFGQRVEVVKLTLDELLSPTLTRPAIVLCDRLGNIEGKYCLFLGSDATQIDVVNGDSMLIDAIPLDRFRMDWGGFVLAAVISEPPINRLARSVSIGLVVGALLSVAIRQLRPKLL